MTLADFQNGIRILLNLDRHNLADAGVLRADDEDGWMLFQMDPCVWALKADEQTGQRLWALMKTRMRP